MECNFRLPDNKAFVVLFAILLHNCLGIMEITNRAHLDPGISFQQLATPILYSKFTPVLINISIPKLTLKDIEIKWPINHSVSCDSNALATYKIMNERNYSGIGCGIVHPYNEFLRNVLKFELGAASNSTKNLASKNKTANGFHFSCERIERHFTHGEISEADLNNYLRTLHDCNKRLDDSNWKNSIHQFISDKLKTQASNFSSFLQTYRYQYINALRTSYSGYATDSFVAGIYTNAYSAFQTLSLLSFYRVLDAWRSIFSECSMGYFPSLISSSELFTYLKNLTIYDGSELSIPLESLHMYYKLKLTDCAMDSKRLIIRLLVPLKPVGQVKFVEILPVPFLSYENNSSDTWKKVCSLYGISGRYLLEQQGQVHRSDCEPHSLCFHPTSQSNYWKSLQTHDHSLACVQAALQEALNINTTTSEKRILVDQMNRQCDHSCVNFPSSELPLILRTRSDRFVIVGPSENSHVFLTCGQKPYHVLEPPRFGAMEVTLSCDCKIDHYASEYYPRQPCGNNGSVVNIMPLIDLFTDGKGRGRVRESNSSGGFYGEKTVSHDDPNFYYLWLLVIVAVSVSVISIFVSGLVLTYVFWKNRQWARHPEQSQLGNGGCRYSTSEYDQVNFMGRTT